MRDIARNHNAFLSTQPIAWVNTFPNMHTGPDGKKVWEAGEPMDAAGYRTFRGENVATGASVVAVATLLATDRFCFPSTALTVYW